MVNLLRKLSRKKTNKVYCSGCANLFYTGGVPLCVATAEFVGGPIRKHVDVKGVVPAESRNRRNDCPLRESSSLHAYRIKKWLLWRLSNGREQVRERNIEEYPLEEEAARKDQHRSEEYREQQYEEVVGQVEVDYDEELEEDLLGNPIQDDEDSEEEIVVEIKEDDGSEEETER